jgi:hypothetical protein
MQKEHLVERCGFECLMCSDAFAKMSFRLEKGVEKRSAKESS